MSGELHLQDYTLYTKSDLPEEDDLSLLQRLQEKMEGESCVFLPSDPRKEDEYPKVFRTLEQGIMTQNYVGLASIQGKTIIIRSRFDGKNHWWFLRYLMENAWGVSYLLTPPGGLAGPEPERQDFYLWLLVCRLAMQLQAAWKKGTFRTYQSFDHYDSRVRGQLDIPRYIRLSMGLNDGRIAYRTREYSPDNPYNRLILCAVGAAERRYPQWVRRLLQQMPECEAAIQFLRQQLHGWEGDRPRSLMEYTRKKITHPLYRGYEDVRITARAVLQWMGREVPGEDNAVGILLNMDQLWEKFLENIWFSGKDWSCQQSFRGILGGHMTVIPDFYCKKKKIVLDAKNRPVWNDTLDEGEWSQSVREYIRENVYQVLSYMLILNCPDGGVIFPVSRSRIGKDILEPSCFQVSGLAKDRTFWRIPFVIPDDADSYEAFREDVQKQADVIRGFDLQACKQKRR